jgi:L-threonylcarbamoyladenylate synthase
MSAAGEPGTRLTRSPRVAAGFIRRGEVVAFPTETVYGLGADIFNEAAVRKIFAAKGRPADNPLIAHISSIAQLESLAAAVPSDAARLIAAFFPGPLTLVLAKSGRVPASATAGLETVGVRMPRHALAQEFLAACGVPLVAPSANLSGRPSPTTWQAVRADLDGRIGCILKGAQTEVGLESTVVDCAAGDPVLLRAGAITLEQIREVTPHVRLADDLHASRPRSPGLKYRHYAPRARVVVVARPEEAVTGPGAAYIGLDSPPRPVDFARREICAGVDAYARAMFHFFRRCDADGIEIIYCQAVAERGIGLALMDRLRRAAAIAHG